MLTLKIADAKIVLCTIFKGMVYKRKYCISFTVIKTLELKTINELFIIFVTFTF